ncbi:hypothetical protein BJX70DRAFT_399323, partial [Aspergillus crustosus]
PVKPWLFINNGVRVLNISTELKRLRFGRFIGLAKCESPVEYTDNGGARTVAGKVDDTFLDLVEQKWQEEFDRSTEIRKTFWQAVDEGREEAERIKEREEAEAEKKQREEERRRVKTEGYMKREKEKKWEQVERLRIALIKWEEEKEENRKRVRDELEERAKKRRKRE